jgi:hypothetical protein
LRYVRSGKALAGSPIFVYIFIIMLAAEQILALAERLVTLKQERERIDGQIQTVQSEYNELITRLTARIGETTANGTLPEPSTLRDRILEVFESATGQHHVDQLQDEIGIGDTERKQMLWTLYNLKKAGMLENPRRGYWMKKGALPPESLEKH